MKQTYSVGEAAKLCGVKASTLRYYDEIGILKPTIDETNQYRSYKVEDLVRVRVIQNLRALQFSLNEIESILKIDDRSRHVRTLEEKRCVMEEEMHSLQQRMNILDEKISSFKQELSIQTKQVGISEAIQLKSYPERYFVSIEKEGNQFGIESYALHFNELLERINTMPNLSFSNLLLIHHHIDLNEPLTSLLLTRRLEFGVFGDNEMKRVLPAGTYVTWMQRGMAGHDKFKMIYEELQRWLGENGYQAVGPLIDVFVTDPMTLSLSKVMSEIYTEIQIQIKEID